MDNYERIREMMAAEIPHLRRQRDSLRAALADPSLSPEKRRLLVGDLERTIVLLIGYLSIAGPSPE